MSSINEEQNNLSKELLPLIEYAKWELHNFNLLKKTTKVIQRELIIIDKDLLRQWKEKSGYNIFKKQIFNYLYNMNKIKNQKEKINEETNKLNTIWKKAISDKKINPSNINTLPKKDMGIFFLDLKEKQIDGYKNYEIISAKLYEYFKNFINYKIKIDGFYNKGKLIIPLNYKNKINNSLEEKNENFLEIIYINNKNESEDMLYILPNDINLCNKIEKDLIDDTIDNLIKNIFSKINEQENKKEFYYCGEDGNQISYKVLNKKLLLLNQKYHIKDNKNIKNQNIQKNNTITGSKNIMIINNSNNQNNPIDNEKDIDKLRAELLKKMKNFEILKLSISERNNNLTRKKNDLEKEKIKLNEEKNKYYKEQEINNINEKNDENNINEQKIKIEDLKNKCLLNEKEYKEKQQELSKLKKQLLDKEKFLNSYINKNNNIIKSKEKEYNQKNKLLNNEENEYEKRRMTIGTDSNNYLLKEDNLKNKEKILNEKDNELIIREKALKERENKINEDKLELIQNENELNSKLEELNEKLLSMKNKEFLINIKKDENENEKEDEDGAIDNNNANDVIDDKELAKIQEELEEEMNLENNNNNELNNQGKKK